MAFSLKHLCTPSYVYFIISMIMIVAMAFQNYGNATEYCMGSYTCAVSSIFVIFMIKIMYVLLWTWILNLICDAGVPGLSWFLLLLPFLLMFVMIGMVFIA
jgi:hypothetical protein